MGKSSRRIAVLPDEDDRSGLPPRRSGRALPFAVAIGLGIGVLALYFAYRELRDARAEEPAVVTPSTAAETTADARALRIVFPEGFTRNDMAQRVVAVNRIARNNGRESALTPAAYLEAANDASLIPAQFLKKNQVKRVKNLEGFLFPATYEFLENTSAAELVQKQLDAFVENWGKVKLADKVRPKNLTPYEILIVASIVEKEVRVPRERKLVAAVIYNRLARGMPLGIDATLRYGLDIPNDEAIRQSQLDSANPYNTSRQPGLPPTAISNPGLASIQAAIHPADTDDLFFARTNDCRTHYFTDSEADFNAFLASPDSFLNGPAECP